MLFGILLVVSAAAFGQPAVPRPAITGISHMTLYADDLMKSRKFYGTLIGWEEAPQTSHDPGVRFYANHVQYIQLEPAPGAGLDDRLVAIGFLTTNAAAL